MYEVGEKPSGVKLVKKFNVIRRSEFPWTYDVHRDCTSRPLFNDLPRAFNNFFRRIKAGQKPGYPKFKKKGVCKDSFYLANDVFKIKNKRVYIPKLGWVKMRESLRFDGKIVAATVSRRANRWHIAIKVDVDDYHKTRVSSDVVGVDLGIKSSATLSTGEVIEGPKPLAKNLKRLQRLSRQLSRKQEGSKNREKAKLKLAKLYLKISDIRQDHLHKLSSRLCSENQAIGIEDLNVQGMQANHKLARHISDEGWGELRRQLEYKSEIFDSQLVIHDRWFPSSKTCSSCGNVKKTLTLSTRTYRCSVCGLVIDRDLNAALNLVPKDIGEVTPGERPALADDLSSVKPASEIQESSYRYPEKDGDVRLECQSAGNEQHEPYREAEVDVEP